MLKCLCRCPRCILICYSMFIVQVCCSVFKYAAVCSSMLQCSVLKYVVLCRRSQPGQVGAICSRQQPLFARLECSILLSNFLSFFFRKNIFFQVFQKKFSNFSPFFSLQVFQASLILLSKLVQYMQLVATTFRAHWVLHPARIVSGPCGLWHKVRSRVKIKSRTAYRL